MDINALWALVPSILSTASFLGAVIAAWMHRPIVTLGAVAVFLASTFGW